MSKSTNASKIDALLAEVAAQKQQIAELMEAAKKPSAPALEPSDFRIVIVRDIPSKRDDSRTYSQVEVYDNRTGERLVDALIDNERGYGKRKDGGDQFIIYATRRKTPASVTTPAAAAQAENPF
jgi:hypothetical protein